MSILFVILGFVLLVIGGEYLVRASVGLSFKLKLSKIVIGMTVVSFATSAPELIVSLQAALDNHPDLALSNVVGSNIANIALVLSLTAIISPIGVDKEFYKMNWPMMMIVSVALYFFLKNDFILSFTEGSILFLSLIIFAVFIIKQSRKNNTLSVSQEVDETLGDSSGLRIIFWLLLGGVALWGGSVLLVDGAVAIAYTLGVSERIIGVSMVAFGTSVPELAASIVAALRKEKAISMGNLIGSNIFNISSVLGITAMITPIKVLDLNVLNTDMIWMLFVSFIILPLILLPKKNEVARFKGLFLIIIYFIFIYLSFAKP